MGAIIVKGGSVISLGVNRKSPGSLKSKYNGRYIKRSIHCELDAVLGVSEDDLRGSTIFVAGFTEKGNLIKSAPCDDCQSLLHDVGIKKIVYFEKDGTVGVIK